MKKTIALILVLAFCLGICALAGCGDTGSTNTNTNTENGATARDVGDSFDIVYAAVTTSLAPYVIAMSNNMQAMCDANGWNLTQYDGEGNVTVQTEQIANIVADGDADLVILFPVDSEVGSTYTKQLADAGIPCFTIVSDVTESGQSYVEHYIGLDHYGMAQASVQTAIDEFGADAGLKYVILSGWQAQLDYQLREAGVRDLLDENTNWEYLTTAYNGASRADAMDNMSQFLTAYPDLDLVVCLSDEFALGAVQAIKAAGRTDLPVTSIELFQESVQEIKDGYMLCSVTQFSSYVVDAIEEAVNKWLNGETFDRNINCDYDVVTIDNVDNFQPEY